jgi:hypothetical protein
MILNGINKKPLIELLNLLTTTDIDNDFCHNVASIINIIKSKEDDFNHLFYPDFDKEVWGDEHGLILTAFMLKNPNIKSVVGNGLFCTVFEGVDGFIYKVSTNRIRYDVSVDFYKHCINNSNPLFPKIHQLSIVGNDYCLSTEKLTEMDLTEYEELELYSLNESVAEGDILYFKSCLRYGTKATPEQMKEIFDILHTLHDKHECRLDMFSSNFMYRGEELVFNDPLSMGH